MLDDRALAPLAAGHPNLYQDFRWAVPTLRVFHVFEISLEQGYSIFAMLAVGGAAMLLTVLSYRRAFAMLRPGQRRLLVALRWGAVWLVVLLLFRPVLTYHKELRERPAVLLAVDRSGSMTISDNPAGTSRLDQAKKQAAKWARQLDADFDVRLVAFADRAKTLDDVDSLDLLAPQGQATSLSRAILAAKVNVPLDDLAAIVLVSDGLHNSARDPIDVAKRLGAVVHTVGVGAALRSDASYRDVRLTGIDCPERLLLDNKAKITASIDAVGLAGRVVRVVLTDGDEQIGQTELALDNLEGSQSAAFEFRPTVKGRHEYTVRVLPVAGEQIEQNNQRRAVAMVVEPGIRVLYLEGTLRAEYGALVDRFLAKDPDLEFCALVQTRPNVFLTRSNSEDLRLDTIPSDRETIDKFDVFIIGDLDSSYLRPGVQRLLVDRIRAGAGLVMTGGYHSLGPGGYGRGELGKVLPVAPGSRDVGQITDPFLPRLTPEGVRHPIFAGIAGFFPTSARPEPTQPGLPPLEGCTRVDGARPGASVLAVCPLKAPPAPVLAVQNVAEGRTAVFTGDTTRRWQQAPRALGQDSPFLRFWGQMARWLAGRKDSVEAAAGIEATTDKAYYEPDEPVRISAVVRDQQGEGAADVKVTAKIRRVESKKSKAQTLRLSPTLGPAGRYTATFQPEQTGTYDIDLTAALGKPPLKADTLTIDVGRPNLEFERLAMDDGLLRQIAEASAGRYEHISTADNLIESLSRQQHNKKVTFERRLYYPPVVWLLLIAALATEWTLRRLYQLK